MEKTNEKNNEEIELSFREITTEDIDEVYKIETSCFKIPWSKQSVQDAAKRDDTVYMLAEYDDKIIAYIGVWLGYDDAEITNVATLAEYRNKNVAARLMAEALKLVKSKGYERITLEVRPSNAPAIALYKKFGMAENGRRKNYYADNNEDALIFWGRL